MKGLFYRGVYNCGFIIFDNAYPLVFTRYVS